MKTINIEIYVYLKIKRWMEQDIIKIDYGANIVSLKQKFKVHKRMVI